MESAAAYLSTLELAFTKAANKDFAQAQSAYMRNQFQFFGMKAGERREIMKAFLKERGLPSPLILDDVLKSLWNNPYRDFQYVAQEMALKAKRKCMKHDLAMYEYMVVNKSWWDTVDFVASNLIGKYMIAHPQEIYPAVDRWMASGNIWLQRSALLFQLKYKTHTDTALMGEIIRSFHATGEFFINKAIGWVLREYGKTNPDWVVSFCQSNQLSALSKREALRIIKKT